MTIKIVLEYTNVQRFVDLPVPAIVFLHDECTDVLQRYTDVLGKLDKLSVDIVIRVPHNGSAQTMLRLDHDTRIMPACKDSTWWFYADEVIINKT